MSDSSFPYRGSQNFFGRDASICASVQSLCVYSQFLGPLVNREFFAIKFKNTISTGVFILLGVGCPSAIFGKIAQIVINTIYAVFRTWTHTHIANEALEALSPLLAHFYASASVALEGGLVWIFTTIDHGAPNSIFGRIRHSMRGFFLGYPILEKATAALCATRDKFVRNDNCEIAASTPAQPLCFAPLILADITKCNKIAKCLVAQVLDSFTRDGHDLRKTTRGTIVEAHQKFAFLVSSRERFADVARHFLLVRTPVSIPSVGDIPQ